MVLAVNRARVSQREIAIAYWGLDEVELKWDPNGWMRGQVRYKLKAALRVEKKRQDGG